MKHFFISVGVMVIISLQLVSFKPAKFEYAEDLDGTTVLMGQRRRRLQAAMKGQPSESETVKILVNEVLSLLEEVDRWEARDSSSGLHNNDQNYFFAEMEERMEHLQTRVLESLETPNKESAVATLPEPPAIPASGSNNNNSGDCRSKSLYAIWEELKRARNSKQANSRIVTNLVTRTLDVKKEEISLCTHVTSDKMHTLPVLEEFWGGPMSIAVWITSQEAIDQFYEFVATQPDSLSRSASYHVYLEHKPETLDIPGARPLYPHNVLRNMAMKHMDTDFFLNNDADIVTKPGAYRDLMKLMKDTKPKTQMVKVPGKRKTETVIYDPNTAGRSPDMPMSLSEQLKHRSFFVLPAFERLMPKNDTTITQEMLPRDKKELLRMNQEKTVEVFYKGLYKIQGPTDYPTYFANTTDWYYPIPYQPNYEPYVLGYKHGAPSYWEPMRGFGWNKQSWFREAAKMGYGFYVLRDQFVVHRNHPSIRKKGAEQSRNQPHMAALKDMLAKRYYVARPPESAPMPRPRPGVGNSTRTRV